MRELHAANRWLAKASGDIVKNDGLAVFGWHQNASKRK